MSLHMCNFVTIYDYYLQKQKCQLIIHNYLNINAMSMSGHNLSGHNLSGHMSGHNLVSKIDMKKQQDFFPGGMGVPPSCENFANPPPPIRHLYPFLDQGLSPPSQGSSPKIWKI